MLASLVLLCTVCWAEGNAPEVMRLQKKADEMITGTNAFYLLMNFNAYVTNIDLYNGSVDTAEHWLENNMPADKEPLLFYKSFQNLVTAKALIVTGNLAKGLELLKEIREFSRLYRRVADFIEAGTLIAVCLWHAKNQEEAVKALADAVTTAQKYELSMPIVKHGADIVPVLQKIMNRLRGGHNKENLDKAFAGELFLGARMIAGLYGGFFSKAVVKPVKLSPKQALILTYLSQNLSQKEMRELVDIKITTIKDHVAKLYQKLGVNNAADALLKARELGLL